MKTTAFSTIMFSMLSGSAIAQDCTNIGEVTKSAVPTIIANRFLGSGLGWKGGSNVLIGRATRSFVHRSDARIELVSGTRKERCLAMARSGDLTLGFCDCEREAQVLMPVKVPLTLPGEYMLYSPVHDEMLRGADGSGVGRGSPFEGIDSQNVGRTSGINTRDIWVANL